MESRALGDFKHKYIHENFERKKAIQRLKQKLHGQKHHQEQQQQQQRQRQQQQPIANKHSSSGGDSGEIERLGGCGACACACACGALGGGVLGEIRICPVVIVSSSLDHTSKSTLQTSHPSQSRTPLDTPARPADMFFIYLHVGPP